MALYTDDQLLVGPLLLKELLEDNKPMDTLLRLYIANCLDESVFRSMALCDSDAFYSIQKAKEEANSKNLLSLFLCNYTMNDREDFLDHEYIDPLQLSFTLETDEDDEPRKLTFDTDLGEKSFIEIYSELVEKYRISKEDLLCLIDAFFWEEKLSSYAVLGQSILDAEGIAYKCIENGHGIPSGLINDQMSCAVVWCMNQLVERFNRFKVKYEAKESKAKS